MSEKTSDQPRQSFADKIPISLNETVPGLVAGMTKGADFTDDEIKKITTHVNNALTLACKSLPDVFDEDINKYTREIGVLLAMKGTHTNQAWSDFVGAMADRKKDTISLRALESSFAKKPT